MIIRPKSVDSKYENIYCYQKFKIGIPIFQRFYAWKQPQIVQLKADLLNAMDDKTKQLYLLDFIYYKENEKVMIADGQQRLVTINNLIKAIKDVANEQNLIIDYIDLFDISYDIFMNNEKYTTHFTNYPTAPFKVVYLEMKKFVMENMDRIDDLIYVIKNNIYAFMKMCSNADDAFEIFQQINTGGKPLTKDEVIKTALDQYSKAYDIKFSTKKIKEVRQSIISYYKLYKNELDQNFDNMAIITFLRDFITKDKESFENFISTIELLKKLEDNPIKHVIGYINRTTLMDVLNILTMKKIDINYHKEYIEKLMIPLCMMSVVLTLNAGTPTAFRYLLNDIIEQIKNDTPVEKIYYFLIEYVNEDAVTWTISIENFAAKLGAVETQRGLKKGLMILDVISKNVSGSVNVKLINLEHIYPQKPDMEWMENGWPTHVLAQKPLIDNIGNYLLLCEEVNKKVKNKYIKHKVPQYESIIEKDKILQTKLNTLDFEKFEIHREEYIKERQYQMANIIKEDMPFGRIVIKNS